MGRIEGADISGRLGEGMWLVGRVGSPMLEGGGRCEGGGTCIDAGGGATVNEVDGGG